VYLQYGFLYLILIRPEFAVHGVELTPPRLDPGTPLPLPHLLTVLAVLYSATLLP
jgi:hypothetical protein